MSTTDIKSERTCTEGHVTRDTQRFCNVNMSEYRRIRDDSIRCERLVGYRIRRVCRLVEALEHVRCHSSLRSDISILHALPARHQSRVCHTSVCEEFGEANSLLTMYAMSDFGSPPTSKNSRRPSTDLPRTVLPLRRLFSFKTNSLKSGCVAIRTRWPLSRIIRRANEMYGWTSPILYEQIASL